MPNPSSILQNFQVPTLNLQTRWTWLKDIIWAVSAGRGFTPDSWKNSRIMAVVTDMPGAIGSDEAALLQIRAQAEQQVNAELAWFCRLIDAATFPDACTWMAQKRTVSISDPTRQYQYGIPSRVLTRIEGKVAIPEDNASVVNYLADACKNGQISKVQLKTDHDLSTLQGGVLYLAV